MLHLLVLCEQTFLLELLDAHVAGKLVGALEPREVPVERLLGEGGGLTGGALDVLYLEPEQS